MSANLTYEHKGVAITLEPATGEFYATIEGKEVVKPSLAAIKKVIDGGVKDKTAYNPPMTGLIWHPRGYDQTPLSERPVDNFRVNIVRVAKGSNSRRWHKTINFYDDKGHEFERVIADTPEAFAALKAYWKRYEEVQRLKSELDEEVRKLAEAIPQIAARDEAEKKGVKV